MDQFSLDIFSRLVHKSPRHSNNICFVYTLFLSCDVRHFLIFLWRNDNRKKITFYSLYINNTTKISRLGEFCRCIIQPIVGSFSILIWVIGGRFTIIVYTEYIIVIASCDHLKKYLFPSLKLKTIRNG